ncbi:MAG: ribonuclease J [Patescibacteria group bacterium]
MTEQQTNTTPHQNNTQTPNKRPFDKQFPKRNKSFGNRNQFRRRPAQPTVGLQELNAEPLERKTAHIPDVAPGIIRIIPLGGVEEIGKNMTAIEIGNDIIVIDAGMFFANGSTPGIDYVIPNTRYLEERKDKIRALVVTHGHLDHIGGVPLVLSRIGNPPVYSRNLSILLMRKRQTEFPHLPPLNAIAIEKDQSLMLGNIKIRFWGVTHTIPDAVGIIIETPYGNIVTPGDYKLDQIDGIVSEAEEKEYAQFDNANNLLLMTDSTNIENEGFSLAEVKVHEGIENILRRENSNRIFMAAFASSITRLIKVVQIAEDLGKKIVIEGRSMKTNLDIATQAGLLKPKKDSIISIDQIDDYPANRLLILVTGAQGEEFGYLNRLANKSVKKVSLKKGDRIILSSSIVPGNERQVQSMKDGLSRQGVKIISFRTPGEEFVHATGHGNKEDIKWLHRKINAKFFIPIHGHHYHLELHKELAMSLGMSEENIVVPDNGSIIEITDNGTKIGVRKEKAPASPMVVDGFSIGDEQSVVLRDRQALEDAGMFVIIATVDQKTGILRKSPDIISRGFVYLKENQELLRHVRTLIKRTVEQSYRTGGGQMNLDNVKNVVADTVSKYLYQKTAKAPVVIPVILSV